MDRNDPHPYEKYCVVRRGTSWFALPAVSVREVCSGATTVPIPRSHPALAGLCHVRSEFLAVLSLVDLAGDQGTPLRRDESLLVMTGPSGPWALLVDEVAAIASLEVSIAVDVTATEGWTNAILGSATYQDKVVRILDPNRLYRLAERQLRDAWAIPQAPWADPEEDAFAESLSQSPPGDLRPADSAGSETHAEPEPDDSAGFEACAERTPGMGSNTETVVEGEHR